MKTSYWLILCIFVLFTSGSLRAQKILVHESGSGDAIPGALVTLSGSGGWKQQGVTDLNGSITFPSQPFAQLLTVRMTGFQQWSDSVAANCETVRIHLLAKPDSLGEVVITAQYGATDPAAAVQPVRVINRERIDAQGAQNLNDVLSTELNIRRSQDQVLGSSMSMQGLSGENVKILIDGVPLIGRLNGSIDLSQVNLANVERIEIVEGPLSVNYGTNALAGAVNLITKRSQPNSFSIQSDNYYESSGHYNFTGRIGGRYKNTIFSVSGGRNFFDGWSAAHKPFYVDWQPVADSTRYDLWKPREQQFASLYVGHYYKRGSFGLMTDGFHETIINRGFPRNPYGESAFDDYYRTRRLSASLSWKHELNQHYYVQAIVAASGYQRTKNTYLRDLTTIEDHLVETASSQDTSRFTFHMLRASLVRGGDSLHFRFEAGIDFNTETSSGQRIENNLQQISDYAVFSTAEYRLHKKFTVRGGLRYAYNTAFTAPLLPSVHLRADITPHVFIRASYASGFRAPSLKELYFYFVDVNHNIRGNRGLRAEQSDNFIASVNVHTNARNTRWLFSLSGFYNSLQNMITLALVSGTEYTYVNIGQFKTTGVNLNIDMRTKQLRVNAGAAYTAQYNILSETAELPAFNWSPEIRASVIWNTRPYDLSFAVFYKYTGKTPGFLANEDGSISNTSINAYHIADISASKKWLNGRLITETGIKNLADVRSVNATAPTGNAHSNGDALNIGTGRQFFFSVRWIITYDKKETK